MAGQRIARGTSVEDRLRFCGWTETPGPLDTPCWVWSGVLHKDGYPRLKVDGKSKKVSRLAYETWVGPIPEGEGYHGTVVRHKCDVRACINPGHLLIGTTADNNWDKEKRNRGNHPKRASHGRSKLSESDVLTIRSSRESGPVLARRLGVSVGTISYVRLGKTWKDNSMRTDN